jgi:predicted transcriptional regulator
MSPIDLRNATFRDITARLISLRASIYEALLEHGPCTTRQLAAACGIDLLTVRPRVTELHQLGLVVLEDTDHHEGIYRALTLAEAESAFNARQADLVGSAQLALAL